MIMPFGGKRPQNFVTFLWIFEELKEWIRNEKLGWKNILYS